jgi:scyllo-inosamine 4-kinase
MVAVPSRVPRVPLGRNPADEHRAPAALTRVAAVAARVLRRHGVDAGAARRANGASNLTWLAGGLAVRVAAGPGPGDLLREARLAARLPRAVGYPRLVEAGVDDGHEWLLTEEVRGANLGEAWPALGWAARERALLELWQLARAVHTVEAPEADARSHSPFYAPTPEAAEVQVAALEALGVLTPARRGSVRAALAAFWAALPAGGRVLCHGDVGIGNALWRGGRVVCLLDFEFAVAAPVELDAHSLLRGLDALDDDLEAPDPQPDPTGAARRRMTEALAQAVRPALTAAGAPDRLRGYAVLYQLWSMLGWLKHWEPGEDYTTWRPFRRLTALADGDDAYLAPLLGAA